MSTRHRSGGGECGVDDGPDMGGPRCTLSCRRGKRCRLFERRAPWLKRRRSGRATAGHGRGREGTHARLRPPSAGGAEDAPEPGCWGCWPRSEASCWLCCWSCWVSIDGGAPSWAGVEASERADMEVMGGVSDPTVIISRFSSFSLSTWSPCSYFLLRCSEFPGTLRVQAGAPAYCGVSERAPANRDLLSDLHNVCAASPLPDPLPLAARTHSASRPLRRLPVLQPRLS